MTAYELPGARYGPRSQLDRDTAVDAAAPIQPKPQTKSASLQAHFARARAGIESHVLVAPASWILFNLPFGTGPA